MRHVGILVSQPAIEPMPPALGAQSLNHWTAREVPKHPNFYNKILEEKKFRIWLTTFYHIYCHHQGPSPQYLSLGLQEPLNWSPCFYHCPLELTLNIIAKLKPV